METTTHNLLVQDKPRSGIAPKNTHPPNTLTPHHTTRKSRSEKTLRDAGDKIVRETAEGTTENTLKSTFEKPSRTP